MTIKPQPATWLWEVGTYTELEKVKPAATTDLGIGLVSSKQCQDVWDICLYMLLSEPYT